MSQCPRLLSPILEVQAWLIAGARRRHKPHSTEGKNKEIRGKKIKPTHREKRTNKQNLKTIDKTNTNQIGTQKEIYTYQKKKRKNKKKVTKRERHKERERTIKPVNKPVNKNID